MTATVTHAQKLIIDGYNVIYTDDSLRRTACKDLQRARTRLIGMLERYLKTRQLAVTLVFDGRGGLVDREPVVPGRLQVLFSARGQTADELIVDMLQASDSPRSYIVVTSDMAHIGGTARDLGCTVIGSKKFLERLARQLAPPREPEPADDRPRDTDYWLEQFGARGDDPEDPL